MKKKIVAFANSMGGTLYIGVADDGSIAGVENPDMATQQIANMIRDSIKPDITMFLHYETKEIDRKQIVAVEVQRGKERPYYLAKKGLRPEGVFIRQGTSSVPDTDTAIRRRIISGAGFVCGCIRRPFVPKAGIRDPGFGKYGS